MSIKMLALDLDNTLLRGDGTVSDYTAGVLAKCAATGVLIAYATARPERTTAATQRSVKPDYVLANSGATLCCNGQELYNLCIPEYARDALIRAFLQDSRVGMFAAECGDCLYTSRPEPPWGDGWNNIYSDFSDYSGMHTPKFSVQCADREFIAGLLRPLPELTCHSMRGDDWYLIMRADVDKADGLERLCDIVGISMGEVAAFGDDQGDIGMLARCGTGVAVENALPEVQAVADYICESNEQDGVAKWIERHLLK